MSAVQFRVLGPLEAVRDGVRMRLGGPRPRAVLAALLLANGRHVRVGSLVDAVWGESPPDTAVKTVQKYISYLRAQLDAPGLIVSRADGYELAAQDVDIKLFSDLVDRAEIEPTPERVATLLTDALELWRGEPYGDLPDLAGAHAERRRLAERRMSAVEALAEARLALGQYGPLVGWLEELVAGNPLRERLWGVLMLALYRCGRQAEALAAFQRLRTTLVEELGAEPTPALRALHERILRQEDDVASTPLAGRRRTRPDTPPLRLTSFVGRDAELDELAAALAGNRMVTLTGPAGSGKTRLAVELLAASASSRAEQRGTSASSRAEQRGTAASSRAEQRGTSANSRAEQRGISAGERRDGAWFIELAGLTDPSEFRPRSRASFAWANSRGAISVTFWPTTLPTRISCSCSTTASICLMPPPIWSPGY